MNTLRNTMVSLVLGAASMAAFAGDNLLVNGDFENGTTAAPVFDANYGFYNSYPVGWTDQGNKAYRYGYSVYESGAKIQPGMPFLTDAAPTASSGTHVLAVGIGAISSSGYSPTGLYQDVTVSAGSLLALSYDDMLNGKDVRVRLFDADTLVSLAISNMTTSANSNGWRTTSLQALSASGHVRILIDSGLSSTSSTSRAYLDNVRLTAAVPEASTWSMMALGLLGLMGLRRRATSGH